MHPLLLHLRNTRLHGLNGTRVTAVVPVAEDLVNQAIATGLPTTAAVRSVTIHAEPGDHFSVRIAPRAALIPSITLKLAIEEQPRLPQSPVLVLRMATLSGLFGLASGAIAGMLPPGVRLDGERIFVDLRTLAAAHGQAQLLEYVTSLQIHTAQNTIVLHVDAAIG